MGAKSKMKKMQTIQNRVYELSAAAFEFVPDAVDERGYRAQTTSCQVVFKRVGQRVERFEILANRGRT